MTQPDLFDPRREILDLYAAAFDKSFTRSGSSIVPPTREELRRARASDPETSKEAAAAVSAFAGLHVARILLALRDHGPLTVSEISYRTKLAEQRINKRLPEMQPGLVDVVTGVTRPGASGRQQRVWRAV